MIGLARVLGLTASLAGGVASSQAPEFAQQYRQRLHGAVEELGQVIADFDADAARSELDRDEALALYEQSDETFLRDRSQSMKRAIGRFDDLTVQASQMAEASPLIRPVVVMRNPDPTVLKGALRDFAPAVPVTLHGLIWAGIGLIAGYGLFRLLALPFRRRKRAVVNG